MKVSKEALWGIVFSILLVIALLYFKRQKCDPEKIIINDPAATEAIEDYEKRIIKSDSERIAYKSLYEKEKEKKEKTKIIYVERYNNIDNASLRGKDSILRANLGL